MAVLLPRIAGVIAVIAGGGGRPKGAGDQVGYASCVLVLPEANRDRSREFIDFLTAECVPKTGGV